MPENALLSHDLFEGIFARAGLVTDIEFFEEFPSHYEVAVVRQHRWARGDWQLLPWIIGHAPDKSGADRDSADRPVEDARQSPPHTVGPGRLSDFDCRLDAAVRCALDLDDIRARMYRYPCPFTGLLGAIPRRRGISKRSHARAVGMDLMLAASHVGLAVTLLAHQAWLMADAIVRTLYPRLCDTSKAPRVGDGSASEIRTSTSA